MDSLTQATTLAEDLNNLRAFAEDLNLQIRRHTEQRDKAIADLKALREAVGEDTLTQTICQLQDKVESHSYSLTACRKMAYDLEIKEGRMRKAARTLLDIVDRDGYYPSNFN